MRIRRASIVAVALAVAIFPSPVIAQRATPPSTAKKAPPSTAQKAKAPSLATAPDQNLTADDVSLRYRDVGTGEPILLIHGYSAALESLIPLANVLSPSYRVIAFDVRGFGKSSKFAGANQFGQKMVDDAIRLLDHLKIPRAHVIGHSMGALIAANLMAQHRDRIASATLIAGPFYPKETFRQETAKWVADLEGGRGLTNFIRWLFPKFDANTAARMNAQSLKANDLPSLIAVMRSLPDLAIEGFTGLRVPAFVAVGTGDPLHSLSRDFAKASPGSRFLSIPGADHMNVVINSQFIRVLREALGRARIRPARGRGRGGE